MIKLAEARLDIRVQHPPVAVGAIVVDLGDTGIDGSGVATLMADAGLTNGAFYAHFASKEDLVATMVADQLREQCE